MQVLVTGGAGYVGSVVCRRLLSHGHGVRVLDSLMYGGASILGLSHDDRFSFVRGDLRSKDTVVSALEGMDAVVHLAAIVGDPACARQPALAREVNHEASLKLFELCRRQEGIQRFVFASTCSNYGRMTDLSSYLTEDSELRPVSLYAETKVAVERALLQAACEQSPVVTILRFATAFGLSPRMRFDLTVNEFTMELLTKRKVTIYGEQFWRPYLHVVDIAEAVRLTLEAPATLVHGQAFNVGDTTQNYQKGRLAELICEQIGDDCRIERIQKAEDPRDYRVRFDKVAHTLGFRISRPVEAGVREIIEAITHGIVTDVEDARYRN